jgi:hypothetical protein
MLATIIERRSIEGLTEAETYATLRPRRWLPGFVVAASRVRLHRVWTSAIIVRAPHIRALTVQN